MSQPRRIARGTAVADLLQRRFCSVLEELFSITGVKPSFYRLISSLQSLAAMSARCEPLRVAESSVSTSPATFADLVLPSTTQLEHFDVQGAWGHHYISVNLPAIAPLGESKSHGEMMRLLAPRMGLCGPAFSQSDEEIAAAVLPDGVTLDDLRARGFVKSSPPRPVFGPNGVTVRIHETPTRPAVAPDGLQLITPKAHQFLNSTFVNMPRQRKAEGHPTLKMHPADAALRALASGMEVRIHNERGTVRAVLEVSEDIRAGAVALPGKWWHLESGNLLTSSAYSPGGQPAYNDTHVEVCRETEEMIVATPSHRC